MNIDRFSITKYKEIENLMIPKGPVSLNKSTFTHKGFKSRDVLLRVNPKLKTETATYLENIQSLTIQGGINPFAKRTDTVTITCNSCGFEESLTIHSLMRRSSHCRQCAGKTEWLFRENEFLSICKELKVSPLYNKYSDIVNEIFALKCENCSFEDTRTFQNFVHKKSFECYRCSNTQEAGSRGRKLVIHGHKFDSQIEATLYEKLISLGIQEKEIQVHVPYKSFSPCDKDYVCDFIIFDKLIIEVTSFTRNNNPKYYNTIDIKSNLISNTKYKLLFINTLAGVRNLSIQDIVYSL